MCVCATVEVIIEIDRYVLLPSLTKGERSVTAEQMPSRVIDEERCSACAAPHHRISQLERVMNLNSSVLGSAQHQRRQLQFIAIGVWRISSVTRPFPALGGVCTKEATCSLSPRRKIIKGLLHFREILNEMKQI